MSAARAMSLSSSSTQNSTSSITGANANLLQHVCLVFTSALGIMTNQSKQNSNCNSNSNSNASTKKDTEHNNHHQHQGMEQIELLTIDPLYLDKKSQNGLEFLNDADQIIDSELKKLQTYDEGSSLHARLFLSGSSSQRENNGNSQCHSGAFQFQPIWFTHFIESDDTPIPVIIVLLARIEQSIRNSYNFYHRKTNFENGLACRHEADGKTDAKESLKPVRSPPSSPTRDLKDKEYTDETVHTSEDNFASESFLTPPSELFEDKSTFDRVQASKEPKTKRDYALLPFLSTISEPCYSTPNVDSLFTETLGSWKHLNGKNLHDGTVRGIRELIQKVMKEAPDHWHNNAEKVVKSFALKDLLLVPICSVLLIRPPSILGINQSLAYISLLVSQWRHIITTCLSKVKDELSRLESLEMNDSLVADLENLLDDNAVAKPGNGKKKRKKKKKKVRLSFC